MKVRLVVNATPQEVEISGGERLSETLRTRLGLTGTKVACGMGECGACTVLVDGTPRLSCVTLTAMVGGAEVRTVEGIAEEAASLRRSFAEEGGLQCGFCTPGQLMMACAVLESATGDLDEDAVTEAMAGNLCRCTGYLGIRRAVLRESSCRHREDPA